MKERKENELLPGDEQLVPGYWANRRPDDAEKDWLYGEDNWISGYWESRKHSHRNLILKALENIQFGSLLEVGCGCGPNLNLIHEKFPDVAISGIDINPYNVEEGKKLNTFADIRLGNLAVLPWGDNSFDIVLSDATLLYISPEEIEAVMEELNRVTKKAIILVERFDPSLRGEIKGHVWARNYPLLLKNLGFSVECIKLDEKTWDTSVNWQRFGALFIATKN